MVRTIKAEPGTTRRSSETTSTSEVNAECERGLPVRIRGGLLVLLGLAVVLFLTRSGIAGSGGVRRLEIGSLSMAPTLIPGEEVHAEEFNPRDGTLGRYELVIVRPPVYRDVFLVMRVIGLPNEAITISSNSLSINRDRVQLEDLPAGLRGRQWLAAPRRTDTIHHQLTEDEVFVVGDNLAVSWDCRDWGPVKLTRVVGVVKSKHKVSPLVRWLRRIMPDG